MQCELKRQTDAYLCVMPAKTCIFSWASARFLVDVSISYSTVLQYHRWLAWPWNDIKLNFITFVGSLRILVQRNAISYVRYRAILWGYLLASRFFPVSMICVSPLSRRSETYCHDLVFAKRPCAGRKWEFRRWWCLCTCVLWCCFFRSRSKPASQQTLNRWGEGKRGSGLR